MWALLGRLYSCAVLPFHRFVFKGALKGIEIECTALVVGSNVCPRPGEHARRTSQHGDSANC